MEFEMRTYIYKVVDLSDVYGEAAYGVEDTREGVMVSVWTDHEMALDEAQDLDYCA